MEQLVIRQDSWGCHINLLARQIWSSTFSMLSQWISKVRIHSVTTALRYRS